MRASLRRPLLGALALGLASGALAAPAHAANGPSKDAAGWLAGQPEDGVVEWGGWTYYGPSLDIFFALEEVDRSPRVRNEILSAMEVHADEYTSFEGTVYAGPTGKLLAAVLAAGISPSDFADGDLLDTLTGRVLLEGPQKGRATDGPGPDEPRTDWSNTLGQSWVVRALAGAGDPLASSATEFLLQQQCEAGFFREDMGDSRGSEAAAFACDTAGDSTPSVDATALAVLSLRAARAAGIAGLGDDIRDAVSWLRSAQRKNGAFVGNDVPNANSTGLAAWVLSTSKWTGSAGTAAAWLAKHQVTPPRADGTALQGDIGAVAYNKAAFAAGKSDGVDGDLPQWILATAQATVGLDALLPRTKLTVKAPARAERRDRVRVRVTGLEAGERWTVRRGKKKVDAGWANRKGVAVTKVKLPKRGKVRLVVKGSRAVRSGVDVVRVR